MKAMHGIVFRKPFDPWNAAPKYQKGYLVIRMPMTTTGLVKAVAWFPDSAGAADYADYLDRKNTNWRSSTRYSWVAYKDLPR